jgi:hypothetical protein
LPRQLPRPRSSSLLIGQPLKGRLGLGNCRGKLDDGGEIVVVDGQWLEREPAAGLLLHPPAPAAVGQLVGGDPVQPGEL